MTVCDDAALAAAVVAAGGGVVLIVAPGQVAADVPHGPGRLAVLVGDPADPLVQAAAAAMVDDLLLR